MNNSDFVHLHVHTQYSLLDGALKIKDALKKAGEFKMPALAITDHGNMFGAIQFYKEALQIGIKPILGCEVYIAPGSRLEKSTPRGIAEASFHFVLLVKNLTGYHNLIKLVSKSYLEGFYYRPRIDKELLAKYSSGLIGLSACLKGEIPSLLSREKFEDACKVAEFYRSIFDKNDFYIEIQDNGIEAQKTVNKRLIELAGRLSLPVVATNDCHYLSKSHVLAHEVLLCVGTGKNLSDTKRLTFSSDQFYFKSPDEMRNSFKDIPEAIHNTLKIAEKCDLKIEFDKSYLPVYQSPEGLSLDDYLIKLAKDGLEKRLEKLKAETGEKDFEKVFLSYRNRLDDELRIITEMNFAGYFLIVWDFIKYAREQKIPVGPGRGSAAGSVAAYGLNITDVDPIKYGLIFERFLNPERKNMPDIDTDICKDRRDEVIKYVKNKYGKDNVGQIITFGQLMAKAVVRDVGRVLGMPYAAVDSIAKLIPTQLKITLGQAIEKEPELKRIIQEDQKIAELFEIAKILEGLTRQASTHAAGVVISPRPLDEFVPLYKSSEQKGGSKSGEEILTQYAMDDIQSIGLLKMDLLGLKTLTVIQNTIERIKQNREVELDLDNIPMNDSATYKLFSEANTVGVFQLESSGMRDLLRNIKPNLFEDLIALIALYRPGPMQSGMNDDFVKAKHGKRKVRYELPILKPILENTYGVILYQEQVMKIANEVAGFSLAEADILRSAMGKKKYELMTRQREKFIEGAKRKGFDSAKAEKIFDLMAKFAGYGFNKSHSTAYALIAYRTAYLKVHYPVEFMAALLSSEMDNTDKIVKNIADCREMEIEILPPDINESFSDFTIKGNSIRFGLAAIKNVGVQVIESIIRTRNEIKLFKSLFDFCVNVDLRVVNKRVVESLILSGAFDRLGGNRHQMVLALDLFLERAQKIQKEKQSNQVSLFGHFDSDESPEINSCPLPDSPEWPEHELLSKEKEILGFYLTGHPLARYASIIERVSNCDCGSLSQKNNSSNGEAEENFNQTEESPKVNKREGEAVNIGGLIKDFKKIFNKNNEEMAFLNLEDLNGVIEVVIFSDIYKKYSSLLEKDTPVLVKGKVSYRNHAPKILAEKIIPLEKAEEELTSRILIDFTANGLSKELLFSLKELLIREKGKCSVTLKVATSENLLATIDLDQEIKISPCKEILQEIEKLTGEGTVHCLIQ